MYLGIENTAEGDSVEEASTGPSLTRLTMKEFAGVVASPKTRSLAEQPSEEDFKIEIAKGDQFYLKIDENPTTGYGLITEATMSNVF